MKASSRAATLMAATTLVTLGGIQSAEAATGKYDFTADFKYRLTSGSFHTNDGTNTFHFQCTAGSGQQYTVTFWQEKVLGDDKVATLTFTCSTSSANEKTWSAPNDDDYHFVLTKSDNGVYVVGSGWDQYQK